MATQDLRNVTVLLSAEDDRPVPIYSTLTGPQMLTRNIQTLQERRDMIAAGDTFARPLTKFETRMVESGIVTEDVKEAMDADVIGSDKMGKGIARDRAISRQLPVPFSQFKRPYQEPVSDGYRPAYSYNLFVIDDMKKKTAIGLKPDEIMHQEAQLRALGGGRGPDPYLRRPGLLMEGAQGKPVGSDLRFDSEKVAMSSVPKEDQSIVFMNPRNTYAGPDNTAGEGFVAATQAPYTHRNPPRFTPGEYDNGAGIYDPKAFNFHNTQNAIAEANQADPMGEPSIISGNARSHMGGNSNVTAGPTQALGRARGTMNQKGDVLTAKAFRR